MGGNISLIGGLISLTSVLIRIIGGLIILISCLVSLFGAKNKSNRCYN